MTLEEYAKYYRLDEAELRFFLDSGLLACPADMAEQSDCGQLDLERLGFLRSLRKAGIPAENLALFIGPPEALKEKKQEQLRLLKKLRYKLLEHLHQEQQQLDNLDYLIHKIKLSDMDLHKTKFVYNDL